MPEQPKQFSKQFLVHAPTRDLESFRAMARQVARLKSHGRVLVNISAIAEKAFHEMPEGGSGWHEYAINSPSIHRVFPHPLIAPHVPAEFVQANRKLLLAKAAILREMGLEAYFWAVEPFFLPESFFRQHPHLRGPRVDHPRRSRREEFALCVDMPQTQEMYRSMVAELRKAVPHLRAYVFKTNDAGGSLCWAAALYSGRSGPGHCEHLSPGQHVANFAGALRSAARPDDDFTVFIGHSNFWDNEIYDIPQHLPAGVVLTDRNDSVMSVGSMLSQSYPVRGMLNPLAILQAMQKFHQPAVRTVFVDFRASYDRCNEQEPTAAKVVDLIDLAIRKPATGLLPRLRQLRDICAEWVGKPGDASAGNSSPADDLLQAFVDLEKALFLRQHAAPGIGTTAAISARHMTRPLVFDPQRLTPQEEEYFLPYVFNVSRDEARDDYIDVHGSRMSAGNGRGVPGIDGVLKLLASAAGAMDKAGGPAEEWSAR